MKFDVIIGNPPYQLETGGGTGRQAKPLYNLFVTKFKLLNPKYLVMIIPSRWFSGGIGLDCFRNEMMNDKHISHITDYINAKNCFPKTSISGGVCFFLWDRNYNGDCNFISVYNGKTNSMLRSLNEFPLIVRYNQSISILRKIYTSERKYLSDYVSSIGVFGIPSKEHGRKIKKDKNDLKLYSSSGTGYIAEDELQKGYEYINKYKVMVSKTGAEHACEPDQSGSFRVLTSALKVLSPREICNFSYIIVGNFAKKRDAENLLSYLKTKFARFLILMAVSSINISRKTFSFVPVQDFSKSWTDDELYIKYNLAKEEIKFIESMIKPME